MIDPTLFANHLADRIVENPGIVRVCENKKRFEDPRLRERLNDESFLKCAKIDIVGELVHSLIESGLLEFRRADDEDSTTIFCRLTMIDTNQLQKGGKQ